MNIVTKNYDYQLQIVRTWVTKHPEGYSLEKESENEEVLLTFNKLFSCADHAKAAMTSKMVKSIFKACQKNHQFFNQ